MLVPSFMFSLTREATGLWTPQSSPLPVSPPPYRRFAATGRGGAAGVPAGGRGACPGGVDALPGGCRLSDTTAVNQAVTAGEWLRLFCQFIWREKGLRDRQPGGD